MTLEARRKNEGKQYTVVSTEDRVIRYWHRPGDHLPVMLTHAGKDYLLTKEVVEEARIHQRSKLVVLKVSEDGKTLLPAPKCPLKKPKGSYWYTKGRAGSSTMITTVDEEINWKAVALVVFTAFALACFATVLTLGA